MRSSGLFSMVHQSKTIRSNNVSLSPLVFKMFIDALYHAIAVRRVVMHTGFALAALYLV